MKIQEQEWNVSTRALCNVVSGDAVIAVVLAYTDTEERDFSRFIAAAPKMARALLGLGRFGKGIPEEWHTHECWDDETQVECMPSCSAARSVLRGAGVL